MMEHVPLYLNGCLSYISSHSLCPSPTLKLSNLILNTASILLLLHSLPSKGLGLSTSPMSPRRPRHFPWPRSPCQQRLSKFIISLPPSTSLLLCNLILPLFPLINCRLINSVDYRIVRLCRHCDKCLCFLTTCYPTLKAAKWSK
jgi:hypothetical protein